MGKSMHICVLSDDSPSNPIHTSLIEKYHFLAKQQKASLKHIIKNEPTTLWHGINIPQFDAMAFPRDKHKFAAFMAKLLSKMGVASAYVLDREKSKTAEQSPPSGFGLLVLGAKIRRAIMHMTGLVPSASAMPSSDISSEKTPQTYAIANRDKDTKCFILDIINPEVPSLLILLDPSNALLTLSINAITYCNELQDVKVVILSSSMNDDIPDTRLRCWQKAFQNICHFEIHSLKTINSISNLSSFTNSTI